MATKAEKLRISSLDVEVASDFMDLSLSGLFALHKRGCGDADMDDEIHDLAERLARLIDDTVSLKNRMSPPQSV